MARMPTPGSDNGKWGQILNDYLSQSHNPDGTIKVGAVSKSDVGLGNVDNTSDANKPVSVATQAVLAEKLNTADLDTQTATKISNNTSATNTAVAAQIDQRIASAKIGNGYFDKAFATPGSDDTPAITVSTTSIISGGTTTRPLALTSDTSKADWENDTHFRYDGAPSGYLASGFMQVPYVPVNDSGTDSDGTFSTRVHFVTPYTDTVEISFKPPAVDGNAYRLWVNNQPLTIPAQRLNGLATAQEYFLQLVFPRARRRLITWENGSRDLFGGVRLASGTVPTRPIVDTSFKIAFLGDSYTMGASEVGRIETWCNWAARLLGATDFAIFGIGGTGFEAGGGAPNKGPYAGRVQAIIDYNPDLVIVQGTINDDQPYDSGVEDAAFDVLSTLKEALPAVIVTGVTTPPYTKTNGDTRDYDGGNESVRGAALRAGVRFIDPQADAAIGNGWFDVTAADGDPTDFISDEVHPNLDGHLSIAQHYYDASGPYTPSAAAASVQTALELSADLDFAQVNDDITITATLAPGTLTGTIKFSSGADILGTEALVAGAASITTSWSSAGLHTIDALFTPDAPGVNSATASMQFPVIDGYSLGANDYTHRWIASDIVAADGTVVTSLNDHAGDDPLARAASDDTQFTIQTENGARFVRVTADSTSGKLSAPGATDAITTIGIMRHTKVGRVPLQSNFYNFMRQGNGNWVAQGTGASSTLTSGGTQWVIAAFIGDAANSSIRVGDNVADAGTITAPGSGSSYSAGVNVLSSTLDASGTTFEFAELITYNRHLTNEELTTIFTAIAANSPLV